MTFITVTSAILVVAWAALALADKERSILFALIALSNASQLAKTYIPLPVYAVAMLLVGVFIIAEAQICHHKKNRGALDVMYVLIGIFTILNGIVAF